MLPQVVRLGPDESDLPLLAIVLALMVVGLVAIASATITKVGGWLDNGYLLRQLLAIAGGAIACALMWRYLPMRVLRDRSLVIAAAAVLLLAAVAVPGIGTEANSARRWFDIGFAMLQPVEFAKPALLAYACSYCASERGKINTASGLAPLLLVMGCACLALLAQPDFGSAVLLCASVGAVMFLAGASIKHLLALAVAAAGAAAYAISLAPYRFQRLISYIDPFSYAQGSGYQQVQALLAWGNGGWTGRELGLSVEMSSDLPEAHTDFIASVLAEETGLVGIIVILVLYAALVVAAFDIARAAERRNDFFAALLGRGIAVMLTLQVTFNIGLNLALLPVKGLTLPLLSYGGSSIAAWMVTLVLLLLIRRDNLASERSSQQQP